MIINLHVYWLRLTSFYGFGHRNGRKINKTTIPPDTMYCLVFRCTSFSAQVFVRCSIISHVWFSFFRFFPVLINRIMTVCFLQPFHLLSTLLFCPASSTLLARFLPLSLSMCPYVYCCCYSECGERKKIVLVSFFFFDFCAFHSTSRLRLLCIFLFRYLKCVPNILFSFFIFCAPAGIMEYMCACLMNKCICVHQFVRGIECVSVGFCVLLEFTMRFFFRRSLLTKILCVYFFSLC